MGLRKKFREKADRREQSRRLRIERQLEMLADKLPAEIEKARQDKKHGMSFIIKGLERYDDAKTFSGYRRLHEICAAAGIRIEETRWRGGSLTLTFTASAIVFNPGLPYNASPDAKFFAPKKPVWVQPPLPGL